MNGFRVDGPCKIPWRGIFIIDNIVLEFINDCLIYTDDKFDILFIDFIYTIFNNWYIGKYNKVTYLTKLQLCMQFDQNNFKIKPPWQLIGFKIKKNNGLENNTEIDDKEIIIKKSI